MKKKKVSKAKKPSQRKRYFGITKIKGGTKFCWLSAQNKHGWSLGFALNDRTVWLRNIRFANPAEVQRALDAKVVFIKLK